MWHLDRVLYDLGRWQLRHRVMNIMLIIITKTQRYNSVVMENQLLFYREDTFNRDFTVAAWHPSGHLADVHESDLTNL